MFTELSVLGTKQGPVKFVMLFTPHAAWKVFLSHVTDGVAACAPVSGTGGPGPGLPSQAPSCLQHSQKLLTCDIGGQDHRLLPKEAPS